MKSCGFSSSHVWIRELDYKESWALRKWCFWTVVLGKILEGPLDCKESKLVNHKGNKSWIFIGMTDTEGEVSTLWPPDSKNWLIWKDPDAGKDWEQEEKGMSEDEMVGWHHRLNGYEFEQALGDGDGQGGLACCCSWGHRELDTSERLNWTGNYFFLLLIFSESVSVSFQRKTTHWRMYWVCLLPAEFWGLGSSWHSICIYWIQDRVWTGMSEDTCSLWCTCRYEFIDHCTKCSLDW